MSGYIRPSILWHLSRVGAADVATLAQIIGRPKQTLAPVIRHMRSLQELADRPYSYGQLQLTDKGREAATRVHQDEVETARDVDQLMKETQFKARSEEAFALASRLIDAANPSSSHLVVLEGLLRAFEAVASSNPCCTQSAANGAMQVSMRLAAAAAAGRPADAPIH